MFEPTDEHDLAACVASEAGPFEIQGAGSKRGVGQAIVGTPLRVAALSGIVDYRPEELVITALAATRLDVLESTLAQANQRLAFEPCALPGSGTTQTLGGVLAANLAGSRRVTAGAARDHFLGFRAVNGRGAVFRAGGKVVKNVTGYDLPKLLAGSWGTLAVLTEVTLRAVPAAERECTFMLEAADAADAVAAMTRALGSSHEVSCAAFDPASGHVMLRLEGFAPSVAARLESLRAMFPSGAGETVADSSSRALWRSIGAAAPLAAAPVIWRLSVPPSDAPRVVRALGTSRYLLDWGGGLLWIADDRVDAAQVRGALREGHATLVKAPQAREDVAVFHPQPPALVALAARLKAAFDPLGKFNAGRMG